MIKELPDMPAGVIGIRVSGRLSGAELNAFRPHIDAVVRTGDVRIVEVIAPDYEGFGPGGLAADMKLGFGVFHHHSAFKRIAVVTDKQWAINTLHALAWLVPGEFAVFSLDELAQAKEWAAGRVDP